MLKPNDLVVSSSGMKGVILREYNKEAFQKGHHKERLFFVKYDKGWNEVLAWESSLIPAKSMLVPMKVEIL